MRALWCILAAFALAVAIPSPAEAHSPILTVLKAPPRKHAEPAALTAAARLPLGLLTIGLRAGYASTRQQSSLGYLPTD